MEEETERARAVDQALYATVGGEGMAASVEPVLHPKGPALAPLHPAGVRRLKLTSSSGQDALRVTRTGAPEGRGAQCWRSGCATVSRGE